MSWLQSDFYCYAHAIIVENFIKKVLNIDKILRALDFLEARDIAQPLIVLWFFSGLHEIFVNNIVQSNNLPSIITYGNIILLISGNFFNK